MDTVSTVRPRVAILCDDDPMIRQVVTGLLEEWGYESVIEADIATQAIDMAKALRPALVLLDMSLQGMSGIDALPALASAAPGISVVVLTAFDGGDEAIHRAGAAAVVRKHSLAALEGVLDGLGLIPNRQLAD